MKKAVVLTLALFSLGSLIAQEKPPEAGNDYASIMAGDTISVNVMLNDWCMEGHTMRILSITAGEGGSCSFADSIITYVSRFYYRGTDTVRYVLLDEVNGLLSTAGKLVIEVANKGRKTLDINNIDATFNSFGYQFCTLPNHVPEFNVPRGSGRKSIFSFSLWMGGFDEGESLHVAGERYRSLGTDYFPGPVSTIYTNNQYLDWNLVSKISREALEYHQAHWWEPGYQPIEAIAEWPAHGQAGLGQSQYLAPFYDRNGDGTYDPHNGDRPIIRGDLALWNVYNDDLAPHGESGGERIGAEIHMMAYAFDCPGDSIFNNTLFVQYNIINRSSSAYHDFYFTTFTDLDLGNPWDDYVGCDTLLNAYFAYNADNDDESDTIFGDTHGYGSSPPAQAVVFLNQPLSSFIATNNFNSIISDPSTPEEYYNVMTGRWRGGEPITYGSVGYGGDVPVNYIFPGDPLAPEEWSEVSAGNNPGDRRGIGSAGPFEFQPGDTLKLDLAFLYARDFAGDNLSSTAIVKDRIEQLLWYYANDSTPCGKSWSSVRKKPGTEKKLLVYPNPATDYLKVELEDGHSEDLDLRVSDLTGKTVLNERLDADHKTINTSGLARGVYLIEISGGDDVIKKKFIKK
jgi:hypothetical protein